MLCSKVEAIQQPNYKALTCARIVGPVLLHLHFQLKVTSSCVSLYKTNDQRQSNSECRQQLPDQNMAISHHLSHKHRRIQISLKKKVET